MSMNQYFQDAIDNLVPGNQEVFFYKIEYKTPQMVNGPNGLVESMGGMMVIKFNHGDVINFPHLEYVRTDGHMPVFTPI